MALMRMLILLGLLVYSHADISPVTKKEHKFDIIEHDGNGEGAPKNELRVVTTQQNSSDLTQNNNGDNTRPAGNDEGGLENELMIATIQQNSSDLTQNNNGHNTCPAGNDGGLENELMIVATEQNSLDRTQNNEDHTNIARNGEGVLDNEPTMATRQQNSWLTLAISFLQTTLNVNHQYYGTTLPLYMIRASAGEFPRPQVPREFLGHRPTPHVTGELALYWTTSHRGIARTASRLGISTPHELARAVGNLVLWWGTTVMLSGFVSTLQVEDVAFIALICFVLYIRINYLSIINCHSRRLFFATACGVSAVPSGIRLASQHFGETREAMETQNLASNVFYVMALADALVNLAFIAYYYVGLMIRQFDNESQE